MRRKGFVMKNALVSFSIVLGYSVLAYEVLCHALPLYYFSEFWVIPAFFLAFFALEISLPKMLNISGAKMMNTFMIMKVVKILLSLVGLVLYLKLAENATIVVAIVFLSFYFVSLIVETIYFAKLMKKGNE